MKPSNLDPWCSGAEDWGDEDISEGASNGFTAKKIVSSDGERLQIFL